MLMIFLWICTTTSTKVPKENQSLLVCIRQLLSIVKPPVLLILSEFSDFCDITYRKIVHHISVRWLSLQTAVDRALRQYPALCSMFLSKGMHRPLDRALVVFLLLQYVSLILQMKVYPDFKG